MRLNVVFFDSFEQQLNVLKVDQIEVDDAQSTVKVSLLLLRHLTPHLE